MSGLDEARCAGGSWSPSYKTIAGCILCSMIVHGSFLFFAMGDVQFVYFSLARLRSKPQVKIGDHDDKMPKPAIPQWELQNRSRVHTKTKTILLWNWWFSRENWWFKTMGRVPFTETKCRVHDCIITTNKTTQPYADAILFHLRNTPYGSLPRDHPTNQIWIIFNMEAPVHTRHGLALRAFDNVFNWTASYRTNSDLYIPYYYHLIKNNSTKNTSLNVASGKNKMAVALSSNCGTFNKRESLVAALSSVIGVDVYGACGQKHPCSPKNKTCKDLLLKPYKFYLAFENANCVEYITEKLWRALKKGMIPIVYGGRIEDYTHLAPPNSFLHLDNFTSIRELATYMKRLDRNDDEFNRYFQWRSSYSIEYTENEQFVCSVCAKLHHKPLVKRTVVMSKWWDASKDCTLGLRTWKSKFKI